MKDIFYLLFLPLRTEVVLRFFYHTEYFFFQDFWDVVYYVLLWGFCHFYVYSISILIHVVHAMH